MTTSTMATSPRRVGLVARAASLLLCALVLAILVSPTRSFGPPAAELENLVHVLCLGWALIGLALVWRSSSLAAQLAALAVFNGGAVMATLLTPAIVALVAR